MNLRNAMQEKKIILIEDDPIVAHLIGDILCKTNTYELIVKKGTDASVEEALHEPCVWAYIVELDLSQICGFEVIKSIRVRHPTQKILTISKKSDPETICTTIRAGASGHVLKEEVFTDLTKKLSSLEQGDFNISVKAMSSLIDIVEDVVRQKRFSYKPAMRFGEVEIGARECEVLSLLAAGLPITLIADRLDISQHTVNQHLRSIYRKLNVHSRAMAVHVAHTSGLIRALRA